MKIIGKYKNIKRYVELSTEKMGSYSEDDFINFGKKTVSIMIFGQSKNPPFFKNAWDKIHLIEWTIV